MGPSDTIIDLKNRLTAFLPRADAWIKEAWAKWIHNAMGHEITQKVI